jgi:hypothetical protein
MVGTLEFRGRALATVGVTTVTYPQFPLRLEVYEVPSGVQAETKATKRWEVERDRGPFPSNVPSDSRTAGAEAGADPRTLALERYAGIYRNCIRVISVDGTSLVDGAGGRSSPAARILLHREVGLGLPVGALAGRKESPS